MVRVNDGTRLTDYQKTIVCAVVSVELVFRRTSVLYD